MRFAGLVISREETRRKEKIADFIMLINIIHSQPEFLLDRLTELYKPMETGADSGDMDKLNRLKKRGGRGYGSGR